MYNQSGLRGYFDGKEHHRNCMFHLKQFYDLEKQQFFAG